jgi:hypothetical protein
MRVRQQQQQSLLQSQKLGHDSLLSVSLGSIGH